MSASLACWNSHAAIRKGRRLSPGVSADVSGGKTPSLKSTRNAESESRLPGRPPVPALPMYSVGSASTLCRSSSAASFGFAIRSVSAMTRPTNSRFDASSSLRIALFPSGCPFGARAAQHSLVGDVIAALGQMSYKSRANVLQTAGLKTSGCLHARRIPGVPYRSRQASIQGIRRRAFRQRPSGTADAGGAARHPVDTSMPGESAFDVRQPLAGGDQSSACLGYYTGSCEWDGFPVAYCHRTRRWPQPARRSCSWCRQSS